MKKVIGWVKLHPVNIAQKVQIVVEHFRQFVSPLLAGKAKAMVVVGSRLEAVRWQLAMEKYIQANGYKIGTLVAFSGEVIDKDSGPEPFTETTKELNAFAGDERGDKLPKSHGPWTNTGVVRADRAPPYNLSRPAIEKAIETAGFQLWRVARKQAPA